MKKTAIVISLVLVALCILGATAFASFNPHEDVSIGNATLKLIKNGEFPEGSVQYCDGRVYRSVDRYNSSSVSDVNDTIVDGIIACEEEIDISAYNLQVSQLHDIVSEVINSNPQLFHIASNYSYSYGSSGIVISVMFDYIMTESEYTQALKIYNAEIDKIVDYVSVIDNDVEKIIAVNDYICSNYDYDRTYSIYDAYNFIVNKKGVCQAYTLMYIAVMNELDIPVGWALSTAMNHIWNVVYYDGSWYHVDVTWNDPIGPINFSVNNRNTLRSDIGIENTGHYNWTTNVVCDSYRFDEAFWASWSNNSSNFVPAPNGLYYIDSAEKTLNYFDFDNDVNEVMKEFDYLWYTADNTGIYSGMFSGLSYADGLLYFNSPEAIMLYNPENGDIFELAAPSISGGYIYTSLVDGEYFYYTVTDGPSYSETVYRGVISDYMPKYTVTWSVDSALVNKTVMYGGNAMDSCEYTVGTVLKYDGNYHYILEGWTPSPSKVYGDVLYTAVIFKASHNYVDGSCACGSVSNTATGFKNDPDGTRYYYDENTYAKGWATIDGKTYRFDPTTGILFTDPVLYATNNYYFNPDHSTVEGLVEEDGGLRLYKKGVRQYGWSDTDGDGEKDTYFYVSTQLRCEEDRTLFDGVATRRFYKYNPETGFMEVVNGFYTNDKGTQFFKNGLGQYGWITADGVSITDRPGITLSDVHYFAYGDGLNFYMVEESTKKIGGVDREFDENHLVKAYTGWSMNKKTGSSQYYIDGVMQQGWCLTPDGWIYLSRSQKLDENIDYGDAFYGWKKIGGKAYYFRASTSDKPFVVISDAERQLNYNGVRDTYYINQIPSGDELIGPDFYITNPPEGFLS